MFTPRYLLDQDNRECLLVESVQVLSLVRLFATPRIAARQASLSITNSRNSLRLTSIESVMPSSHLILCRPLLLLPPNPPSIRVISIILILPTEEHGISLYLFMSSLISFIQFSSVAQSYPTVCDSMDCSLPGSSLHGILQARVLEWVAISFSRGSS